MGALAEELHPGLQVSQAAGVEDRVRRLEHDRERSVGQHAAREDARHRALVNRDLLACEEDVARPSCITSELEHHRDTAFHIARTEAVNGAVGDRTGDVPLGRDRVDMTGQNDGRSGVAPDDRLTVVVERLARQEPPYELHRGSLVAALRGNVHEL